MSYVFLCLPVIFLAISIFLAIRAVKNGKKARSAVAAQLLSFFAICVITFAVPVVANASASPVDASAPVTTSQQVTTDNSKGLYGFLTLFHSFLPIFLIFCFDSVSLPAHFLPYSGRWAPAARSTWRSA